MVRQARAANPPLSPSLRFARARAWASSSTVRIPCADELLQLRGFDRLGSAFKKNLAQFAGCFITEPGLLCIEFFALLAQLLERITRARFGPGHQIVLSLAVGPLHARQCQHGAM